MESLTEIFARIGHFGSDIGCNDKGGTHSYLFIYEWLFAPFRENGSIMEIGLASGNSLELWGEYFGPNASITGVDIGIVFDTAKFDDRFFIAQADATKPEVLTTLGDRTFDLIVDDGSHMQADQIETFRLLSPRMRPGGIYIIEDILSVDMSGPALLGLHPSCEIIDLRGVKGRFDDVLAIFRA